jgi:hypothetical protein
MSVHIRRLFPERPLTRKDYPGGVLRAEGAVFAALTGHAVLAAGERPLLGFAPDAHENRLVLRALGLTVHEGAVSGPGGLPWCLFHYDLPPEFEAVSEGGPC